MLSDVGIILSTTARGQVKTTCPRCSSDRKKKSDRCLSVNVEQQTWHCHHCGWAGGVGAPREKREYVKPDFKPAPLLDKASEFLLGRGITREVIERNHVSSAKTWMPQRDGHVMALAFPYYRDDEVINVKYRDGAKNFRMEKDAELCLYGLNDIDLDETILVEGEIDKLSLEVAGFKNCVSVPNGAPPPDARNYDAKLNYLAADEAVAKVQHWVLAVDADPAGERLRDELTRRLGVTKVRYVSWPEDCKDANEVLQKHGPKGIRNAIAAAERPPIKGVYQVYDEADRIFTYYDEGIPQGATTGFSNLDDFYKVNPGEVTVVTGIPNSGKSNFMDALATNLGAIHDFRTAFFSPENQPLHDHMARIVEKLARKPFNRGPTERMDKSELAIYMSRAAELFYWILPDDDEWTLTNVLEAAEELVFRHGIRGLVIDPWNELELGRGNLSETEYIGEALKKIRQLARRTQLHIWIVAHPAKLYRDRDGQYPVPTMYDISGSSHWRNKADNGLCVWRDFANKFEPVQVHVQKIRFRHTGKLGMAALDYYAPTATYKPSMITHSST